MDVEVVDIAIVLRRKLSVRYRLLPTEGCTNESRIYIVSIVVSLKDHPSNIGICGPD